MSALVSAEHGRYVVQVRVACRDGSGPFYAQDEASAEQLEAVSAALLRKALPAASGAAQEPAPSAPPVAVDASAENTTPEPAAPAPAAPAAPPPPHFFAESEAASAPAPLRVRIAVREELAVGLASDDFINDLIGARVDFGLTDTLWLGAHLGYANLAGRAGRVHSVLPYAQLEQRIALGSRARAGAAVALRGRVCSCATADSCVYPSGLALRSAGAASRV